MSVKIEIPKIIEDQLIDLKLLCYVNSGGVDDGAY